MTNITGPGSFYYICNLFKDAFDRWNSVAPNNKVISEQCDRKNVKEN
jgi:hypothetical protein